ncbi:hypothetical protein [Streptomyces sp. NPDC021224]|uniref:hypothetical protein n=1 Tax=unclassified Streptomyces TaxID=2593676 RepID=UPI0037894E00
MQTRTKKTLAAGALGLAFAAAAAGTASAAALPTDVLGGLPVGSAANLVPGAGNTAAGAQNALANGTSALPADPQSLLPSGNHLDGNQIAPVGGLLGGLPLGG